MLVLWIGQVLSAIGDQLFLIAAIWLAIQLSGSSAAFVPAAIFSSALIFGLIGGIYADRWNRRTTMIVVDLIRAIAVLTLPIAACFAPITLAHLIVVAVVIGALGALFDPCLQASLPTLTSDPNTLRSTTALMSMTIRIARSIAPTISGLLAVLIPIKHFFSIDTISFIISALSILSLSTKYAWKPARLTAHQHTIISTLAELKEAFLLVRNHKLLSWGLTTHLRLEYSLAIAFLIGAPILVSQTLGNQIGAYGWIVGAFGISGVIATLIIGSISTRRHALFLFAGQLVFGIGLIIFGLAKSFPLAVLGFALSAPGRPLGDLSLIYIIQADVPSNQFGKIFAFRLMIMTGGLSLGLCISQPLFKLFPASTVITTCAVFITIIGAIGFLRFLRRDESLPCTKPAEPQKEVSLAR